MLTQGQLEQIRSYAEEVASREGVLLYDLEFRDGPGRVLRVFIDRESGGVSIEDCANVSRGLNLRLDVEDILQGAYDLEVSSPGLDRKLTQLWHFQKAVGQFVQLKFRDESGAVKPYEGKLTSMEGSKLNLENSKGPFAVEFSAIEKGRIVIGDVLKKKPAPGKHKKR